MKLTRAFGANGAIDGHGIDDVVPFVITGGFDLATNVAYWTKAYVGMHTVEYSPMSSSNRTPADIWRQRSDKRAAEGFPSAAMSCR